MASSSALSNYLLLAKGVHGLAAVRLIHQVLSHKQIYVFGELLKIPNITELENTEYKMHLDLLKLFSHDNYFNYIENPERYPALTSDELLKLKMLTVVDLASTNKVLLYATLLRDLHISTLRELEDLIIKCMYNNLLEAKLDQKRELVEIEFIASRDIFDEDLDSMISKLQTWQDACSSHISFIESKIHDANLLTEEKTHNQLVFQQRKAEKTEQILLKLEQGHLENNLNMM